MFFVCVFSVSLCYFEVLDFVLSVDYMLVVSLCGVRDCCLGLRVCLWFRLA